MNEKEIIIEIQKEMKKFFTQETTGHDWYHIERVWKNAQKIATHYPKANLLQIELAALLHDRYDHKIVSNVEQAKLEVRDLLVQHGLTKELIEKILYSIDAVGFRNGKNPIHPEQLRTKLFRMRIDSMLLVQLRLLVLLFIQVHTNVRFIQERLKKY